MKNIKALFLLHVVVCLLAYKALLYTLLQNSNSCSIIRNLRPRIRLNTFVPNLSISQIRLKSKFKTNFHDSKSKLRNVLLGTFHLEMGLKFTP